MSVKPGQLALLSLFVLVTSDVIGSSQLGYGGTKCSLYNSLHTQRAVLASSMDSWTLGYLSGLNQAVVRSGGEDRIGKQQSDRVMSYVRGYCESNLKKTINDAANSYWYEFIQR